MKPRAIDLFSGCGGLSLGLKKAGFRVVGAIELDALAVETYKKNHVKVKVWGKDIKSLPVSEVMKTLKIQKGELDLLAGCPPCQGFSNMTTLNGQKKMLDSRNDLIFEFLRFVRVLKPKTIMMENVPGLARNRRFKQIRQTLKKLGYKYNYDILDAADYGVPQRRKRLILLAAQNKHIPFAQPDSSRLTVRQAFSGIKNKSYHDNLHLYKEKRSPKILKMIRMIPKDGGSRSHLGVKKQLACHLKCDGFKDVYGRMAWNEVSPTITGGCINPSKGRFLHPSKNRSITLREAALLQSFPPDYFFSLRRGRLLVAQMIGNALPSEFIHRHALQIKETLEDLQGTHE